MKKPLVILSLAYVVIVLLSWLFGALLTEEWNEEKSEIGEPLIYYHDALLMAIKCENTFWDEGVELFLNYPLMMLQGLSVVFWAPWLIPPVVIAWAPFLYLGVFADRKIGFNQTLQSTRTSRAD